MSAGLGGKSPAFDDQRGEHLGGGNIFGDGHGRFVVGRGGRGDGRKNDAGGSARFFGLPRNVVFAIGAVELYRLVDGGSGRGGTKGV